MPGRKGQEFKLVIHCSERTTTPASDLKTLKLPARVLESTIACVPTCRKLQIISGITLRIWLRRHPPPHLSQPFHILKPRPFSTVRTFEVDLEEIEGAVRALNLGKSGGSDSPDPEHMYYGGDTLKFWLKKVFNRILTLEQIPAALNEGLLIPYSQRQRQGPL